MDDVDTFELQKKAGDKNVFCGQDTLDIADIPDTSNTPETTDILTVKELAAMMRVNRKTVYDAAGRGEIPCTKIGRVYRFSKQAVIEWLSGQSRRH